MCTVGLQCLQTQVSCPLYPFAFHRDEVAAAKELIHAERAAKQIAETEAHNMQAKLKDAGRQVEEERELARKVSTLF